MESRIQETLDRQWDALESRDKSIVRIRAELKSLLQELSGTREAELQEVNRLLVEYGEEEAKASTGALRKAELELELEKINTSGIGLELRSLKNEVSSIDAEIAKLQAKRKLVLANMSGLESVYNSRTAKFQEAINELDKALAGKRSISEVQRLINKLNSKRESLNFELTAYKSGTTLWEHVCLLLRDLDNDIKDCGINQLPQISFMLTTAMEKVETDLETAVNNKWTALTVAIGHELQILRDTLKAVKDHESKK